MQVTKRDGRVVEFDPGKVRAAVLAAGGGDYDAAQAISRVRDFVHTHHEASVERIQDVIEETLMNLCPSVAKSYILYREEHTKLRNVHPDPTALADYIHAAKYAKVAEGMRETWDDTVNRVAFMHTDKFPVYTGEIMDAFSDVKAKRVLPSMRAMQFAGSRSKKHHAAIYNCSFTLIDRVEAFGEALYLLLCGCGVGYSVQYQHVDRLPVINTMGRTVRHFDIKDTIEGWGEAMHVLMEGAVAGYHVEFGYQLVRDEGSPLKTSGGFAPGHLPLKEALESCRAILLGAQGRKLKPIECFDIMCFLADCVLAGGVRRSSGICLFSSHDPEMMLSKDPLNFEWTGKNKQRAMANISAVFPRSSVNKKTLEFAIRRGIEHFEPGFYLTNNFDWGTNPCAEIGLDPTVWVCTNGPQPTDDRRIELEAMYERMGRRNIGIDTWAYELRTGFAFCNLTEINCVKVRGEQDFLYACESAAVIGTLQASYTDFMFLGPESKLIAERDALLGVSLTGIMDNSDIMKRDLLERGREMVKAVNVEWAGKLGIRPAVRTTCVKPSGTASLALGGVSSGIHPQHAKRHLRRVTANQLEPVAQQLKAVNPHAVLEKNERDWCIEFPVETKGLTLAEVSAKDFIASVFFVYEHWIGVGDLTHNVSATCAVLPEEVDLVIEILMDNLHRLTAMSFAPKGSDRLPFMPRMEVLDVDEARWRELITKWKPVDYTKVGGSTDTADAACAGGACEL